MKERGNKKMVLMGATTLLIVILIAFAVFSFNSNAKLSTRKISVAGNAIQDVPAIAKIAKKYSSLSPASRLTLIGEWLAVLIIVLIVLVRGELKLREDMSQVSPGMKYEKPSPHTDLDILYLIIKEKKSLRLGTIMKLFGINKKVAMGWCNTLEKANLAILRYPTVGDPRLMLDEPNKPARNFLGKIKTKPIEKRQ